MFHLFKKQKSAAEPAAKPVISILSPLTGRAVPIEQVPDQTFSDKVLGDGIAVRPDSGPDCGILSAPADGVIDSVPDTCHAVMMTTDSGIELLMHIGIDTVELKGEHYRALVSAGDRVRTGQPLIEFDRDAIVTAGYETITPVIVTNSDQFRIRQAFLGQMRENSILLELERE